MEKSIKPKFAREIATEYWILSKDLLEEWNKMRFFHPFDVFPELAKAIQRMQILTAFWKDISDKLR